MKPWQSYDFKLNDDADRATLITSTGPLTSIKIEKNTKGLYSTKMLLSFHYVPQVGPNPSLPWALIEEESLEGTMEEKKECMYNAFKFFEKNFLHLHDDVKEFKLINAEAFT